MGLGVATFGDLGSESPGSGGVDLHQWTRAAWAVSSREKLLASWPVDLPSIPPASRG